MQIELLRHAPVTVDSNIDARNPVAIINVGDYQHMFSTSSRYSKALSVIEPSDLESQLSGGHFFFVDGKLIDLREKSYTGFVHTDDGIANLAEVIGIRDDKAQALSRPGVRRREKKQSLLTKTWSNVPFEIGESKGSQFRSEVSFRWDPFSPFINTNFLIERLICLNGMVAQSTLFNSRIPVVNRWQEHLDIASKQLQNKLVSMIRNRLKSMTIKRASIDELSLIETHARNRLASDHDDLTNEEFRTLSNIARAAAPIPHLHGIYRESVFQNWSLSRQLPGHLTAFDAFNMVTEMRTHTPEPQTSTSTNLALDRLASLMVFDRKDLAPIANEMEVPELSTFSDTDRAFFGEVELVN